MNNILNILSNYKNNETIHYYPFINKTNYIYEPIKLTNHQIKQIISSLNLNSHIIPKEYYQKELYYRDLMCITISNNIMYFKKKTIILPFDEINGLIIKTILEPISNDCFPNLSKYEHVENKYIMIYELDLINLLIIKYSDNNNILCIEANNKNTMLDNSIEIIKLNNIIKKFNHLI
jgi:hypothetical protein